MVNPGLAHWHAAFARTLTLDDVMLMAAQPRFAEAARRMFADSISRRDRYPEMTRVLKDTRRVMYAYIVLFLHARGGVTLARLQQACAESGLVSPGRAVAILAHLRMIGFVRRDETQLNRRERRYVPAPELESAVRRAIVDDLHTLALIEPQAARAADRLHEPEFFRQFMLRAGEGLLSIRYTLLGTTFFAERDAGQLILYDILLSAQPGDVFPPKGPLRMSIKDLSRRYNVSRVHVFRMFRDAEKLGLLTRHPDTQTGAITEETRIAVTGLAATLFIGMAVCCEHASLATSSTAQRQAS